MEEYLPEDTVDWILPASQAQRIGYGVKNKFPLKGTVYFLDCPLGTH